MSATVRQDVIQLLVNINGNPAKDQLNQLSKKAADLNTELSGMKKHTQEYIDTSASLKLVNTNMKQLRDEIGITSLSIKELGQKHRELVAIITSALPGDPGINKYISDLQEVDARQTELRQSMLGVTTTQDKVAEGFEHLGLRVLEYIGSYAIIDTIKNFFKSVIDETDKAEQATTQLQNALQNAGRSDLFDKFSESAENFAKKFSALNANDIKDVFTKLINYGKLTEDQFTSLTQVIIDYAAKEKVTLQAATDVMTQALEGNVRGLKTYGINVASAHTVTERLGLIIDSLGPKLKDTESAFEGTTSGGIATFKENIVSAKEKIGDFLLALVGVKKTQDELFDIAKEKADNYEQSLGPLLQRYDDLKAKTSLNKTEHTELDGIIQKIAEFLPSAVTEFNKYGQAMDINSGKVKNFLEANKDFLAQKEFKAVDELTSNTLKTLEAINKQRKELNSGQTTEFIGSSGGGGGGGEVVTRKSTQDEDAQKLSNLRTLQEKLITDASTLTDKYGKVLPKSISDAVDAIKKEIGALGDVNKNSAQYSKQWYDEQITEANEKLATLKKGTQDYATEQKKLNDLIAGKANIGKTIGGGDPNFDKSAADKYKQLLKEAEDFHKKLQELQFTAEEASKSDDQKEIDAVKHKYDLMLQQYDALQKKLNKQDLGILGPRGDITDAEQKELDAVTAKQKQAQFEKDQKQIKDNLTKEYDDKKQQDTLYYEGLKENQAKRFSDGEIDYKTYQSNIAAIDVKSNAALLADAEEFAKQKVTINGKIVTAVDEAEKDMTAFQKAEFEKRIANAIRAELAQAAEIKILRDLNDKADLSKANSKVIIAQTNNDPKATADAQKALLDLQRNQKKAALDVQAADAKKSLTESGDERTGLEKKIDDAIAAQKKEADDQYTKSAQDVDNNSYQARVQMAEAFASTTLSLATSLNSALNNIEDRKLQKVVDRNNKEKLLYQQQLNQKLLSQKEYDAKTAALDAKTAAEQEKLALQQAKRQKALDIFSAITGTASAVVGALGSKPWGPWNIALAAAVGLLGAVQIGVIATEPLPSATAAEGNWFRTGDKHSDPSGGIPVMIERDEAVVKADAMTDPNKYTVSGTPSQITSKLNSMHGGVNWETGAQISAPKFMQRPAQINSNMPRIMAQGGLFSTKQATATIQNNNNELSAKLDELIDEVKNQKKQLHAVVSIKEYRDKEKQYDNARKASGMSQ